MSIIHTAPGLARLFPLDPADTLGYRAISDDGATILASDTLAAVVIAAAATTAAAGGAWVTRPDVWELHLAQHPDRRCDIACVNGPAPIDAIERVLHNCP